MLLSTEKRKEKRKATKDTSFRRPTVTRGAKQKLSLHFLLSSNQTLHVVHTLIQAKHSQTYIQSKYII